MVFQGSNGIINCEGTSPWQTLPPTLLPSSPFTPRPCRGREGKVSTSEYRQRRWGLDGAGEEGKKKQVDLWERAAGSSQVIYNTTTNWGWRLQFISPASCLLCYWSLFEIYLLIPQTSVCGRLILQTLHLMGFTLADCWLPEEAQCPIWWELDTLNVNNIWINR